MRVCDIHHRNKEAVGGQANTLELGCFREGTIDQITILQVGGVAAAFTYDIYSRLAAIDPGVSATDDPDTPADEGVADPSLYKINGATVSASSGAAGTFAPPLPVKYRNADAGRGMTMAKQRIYIVLTPAGSGAKFYDVRITGLTPNSI